MRKLVTPMATNVEEQCQRCWNIAQPRQQLWDVREKGDKFAHPICDPCMKQICTNILAAIDDTMIPRHDLDTFITEKPYLGLEPHE